MTPRKLPTTKKGPSKRPKINEKRDMNPNFSGLTITQAKELANLLETRDIRISVQKKKSSIANNKIVKTNFRVK